MPTLPRKRAWSQPLADLVGAALDPVLARQGFSESSLILNWDDIVGERLAANSQPIKLQWPPRPPGRQPDMPAPTATLQVRVESGFALELQHMADQVLARINSHLGWRCVGKLSLRQGPLERLPQATGRGAESSAAALARSREQVDGIQDAALLAALTRLGAHVIK